MDRLNWLGARQAAQGIRDGLFSAEDLVGACMGQAGARDPEVQAWACLDPSHALDQARQADQRRGAGSPLGPLHGVPVGIQDTIDTADMPTENGTPLHSGRAPWHDAKAVELLRSAGAVIMGKTATTELGACVPGRARNPHDPAHTPGGSSGGSAAAVADGMAPLALGIQSSGAIIRSASYCGVYGFKPSRGVISRQGILRRSSSLDQVGGFARSVEDLALLAEILAAYDADEPGMTPRAGLPLQRVCDEEPPLPPKLALVKTPWWPQLGDDVREGFGELVAHLGEHIGEFALPESAQKVCGWHRTIFEADMAANFEAEYERGADRMSDALRERIARGRAVPAVDYLKAKARMPLLGEALDEIFDRFDAIVTPAAGGAAPQGAGLEEGAAFCTLWTFCGMPALSLPLLSAENGLPVGVQLVGRIGDDARLLRTARWLVGTMT